MSDILDAVCEALDFQKGSLLAATDKPTSDIGINDWIEKGEWLAAAKRAGADRVFFVDNNPVIVFAECGSGVFEKERTFNRIWCLGRPRLLFLASPGEISVLDLAQKPINLSKPDRKSRREEQEARTLQVLGTVEEVSEKLQRFHRDNIESGKVFGEDKFGDVSNRADKSLIRDLKFVRRQLIQAGLSDDKVKYAHALIGRSIFIRYLEDRGILTKDYFLRIANQIPGWVALIDNGPHRPGYEQYENQAFYPRVLENKDFTYALFRTLARDFNGDIFADVDEEERVVSPSHLRLVQDLLYGDAGVQKKLFFHSYRFDIVPLDLISSIYEEFYDPSTMDDLKKGRARQDGAYYTPPVLAELTVSRALTTEELQTKPRVLDPACGSGVFLVESFRRIVRYQWRQNEDTLSFDELKRILREQIAGIEVNEEAARIAALSLCLALLHYLEPPSIMEQIRRGNKLPNLLASEDRSSNHYHCIFVGNAFDVSRIRANPLWVSRFGEQCADVIVSNPPWGAPKTDAEDETKARNEIMLRWCDEHDKPISRKQPSEAFLWRFVDLLRNKGKAVVLASAGVLFKPTALKFRVGWMNEVRLTEVFNFAHVRRSFFRGGDSPFVMISFVRGEQDDMPVKYWSVKQTVALEKTQAVLLTKHDLNILRNEHLVSGEVWKAYWFGRAADVRFLKQLQTRSRLADFVDRQKSGVGYEVGAGDHPADELKKYPVLDVKRLSRYDGLCFHDPPAKAHRFGKEDVYSGKRILLKYGVLQEGDVKGRIVARYEESDFSFTHDIHGLKLRSQEEWRYKTLLGILWSSLSRYYFFMTSSSWGLWHYVIGFDEFLSLPVVLDEENPSAKRIVAIVDSLRGYHPQLADLAHPDGTHEVEVAARRRQMEHDLDEAIFDLFELSVEEKDLVRDCCEVILPFFYRPSDSVGSVPALQNEDISWIREYIEVFTSRWNTYLSDSKEMRAEIHVAAHDNIIALEFFPSDASDPWNLDPDFHGWQPILKRIRNILRQPFDTSRVIMDGVVYAVSEDAIVVIKRNERRYWTRSLAREDADLTLCRRMVEASDGNRGVY